MAVKRRRRSKKAGLPPGTLMHVGEKKTERVRITLFDYNEAGLIEKELGTIDECLPYMEKETVTWINISGLHNVEVIERLGSSFNIHPLVLEDVLNTEQRPKIEDYDKYLFIVLKKVYTGKENGKEVFEQVSIILGQGYIVTLQESEEDIFGPVRDRLRAGKGRIRKRGADYLAYALMDAVVDNYFAVLERVGEVIEAIQQELLDMPTPETLDRINILKRKMITLRRSVWPLREVMGRLERGGSALVQESTLIYIRDVYDHTIQVADSIESYRDMLSGMLDIYLSSISNRMNEVMKVLTIIATIFIPITFIAGLYGMNFEYMPELMWRWGYFVSLGVMAGVAIAMLLFFRKKRWF
jgi:magnesium transporter